MTPDEFFVLVDDGASQAVRAATADQISYWGRRHEEVDLPGQLNQNHCEQFGQRVLAHVRALALLG